MIGGFGDLAVPVEIPELFDEPGCFLGNNDPRVEEDSPSTRGAW